MSEPASPGGRSTRAHRAVGHGGTGGFRPASLPLLPRYRRLPGVLQRGTAQLLPKHHREMAARNPHSQPPGPRAAGGHPGRPEGRCQCTDSAGPGGPGGPGAPSSSPGSG